MNYSAIILAVAHDKFRTYELSTSERKVVYDVKGVLDISKIDARL